MITLVANRGVIARRIIRTLRRMGWPSVGVYSEADAETLPVREADRALPLGPASASASYLDSAKILHAARTSGAGIIHPGYGFLSENAEFCEACEAEGIAFAGPTPEQIRSFGLKNTARDLARACGLPLLPGTGLLETLEEARAAAETIGYPVMLKSTAGGGGIGMRVCHNENGLREAYESVRRLGETNFRHGGLFLEKFVARARHVEVQIFGDGGGRVLTLGERDCSVQRRNQKVIEESPAPCLPEQIRAELHEAAAHLGRSVQYRSAGTVEFLYDTDAKSFYFLEVNTRLQVEHGVTEEIFQIDLVEWMLRLAAGDDSFLDSFVPTPEGASIQVRLYAEMPSRNFQPSTGTITLAQFPEDIRVETWVDPGTEVGASYDPMLAKLIATGPDRAAALAKLRSAMQRLHIYGLETNQAYLQSILASEAFAAGGVTTAFLPGHPFTPALVDVVEGGIETLVVDWPGRIGYWHVGVPPSGPFDELSFRLANRALGNAEGTPGLEMTLRGPTLKFHVPCWICVTGAEMHAMVDGTPIPRGVPLLISPGQILRVGEADGPGLRGYLALRCGLDIAPYLGSKTTFRLGGFGGQSGRALRAGDALRLLPGSESLPDPLALVGPLPDLAHEWHVGVSYGPHGAPDFFTEADIETFFGTPWEVHYNSARTGVRLLGPKPQWARADGGEAGLHPSNIHDNAYQVGAIDFTGDMPIILGPDGPSLGGFVCPATVLSAELWKVGQFRPGDRVHFHPVALADAPLEPSASREITTVRRVVEPILAPAPPRTPSVAYRRQGDSGVLVEYGEMVLDLHLRFRVQALYEALLAKAVPGLLDLTPGIRSLQVRYNRSKISYEDVLALLRQTELALPPASRMAVPTRIIHLPLSWDDPSTRLAIDKYMQSVRQDAPWCPSNIEFIRRINGLPSMEAVREIVFSASYLVMGLGDVYLGAPVATPLDPRHRLVTTKYNPARTWTPENAVGIGGAYLCIYGMEGPGGYQFVGRTVPVWNRHRVTPSFHADSPWLLRFFDQIRFYPVTDDELTTLRAETLTGRFVPPVEESTFRLADYDHFLEREASSIEAFRAMQRAAFHAERERWEAAGQTMEQDLDAPPPPAVEEIPAGCQAASSPAAGRIWKLLATRGQSVSEGETLAIIESMKMEIPCLAPVSGTVQEVLTEEGRPVSPGAPIFLLKA